MLQVDVSCLACHKDIINPDKNLWYTLEEAFDGTLENTWGRRNAVRKTIVSKETLVGVDGCKTFRLLI